MNNILIESKEWFDRVNGNSYFSSRIEIDGAEVAVLPFQYGYGSHCDDMAAQKLDKMGLLPDDRKANRSRPSLYRWCDENGVKFKSIKHESCLKREVTQWGKE